MSAAPPGPSSREPFRPTPTLRKQRRRTCPGSSATTAGLERQAEQAEADGDGQLASDSCAAAAEEARQASGLSIAQDARDAWDRAHEARRPAARTARQELDRRGIEPEPEYRESQSLTEWWRQFEAHAEAADRAIGRQRQAAIDAGRDTRTCAASRRSEPSAGTRACGRPRRADRREHPAGPGGREEGCRRTGSAAARTFRLRGEDGSGGPARSRARPPMAVQAGRRQVRRGGIRASDLILSCCLAGADFRVLVNPLVHQGGGLRLLPDASARSAPATLATRNEKYKYRPGLSSASATALSPVHLLPVMVARRNAPTAGAASRAQAG
jgi:hypothetical protein